MRSVAVKGQALGPWRGSRLVCMSRDAATTGGGTALILDEVRDLQEVIVEVGRREMRWTRGQVRR